MQVLLGVLILPSLELRQKPAGILEGGKEKIYSEVLNDNLVPASYEQYEADRFSKLVHIIWAYSYFHIKV